VEILTVPNPLLRQISSTVTRFDDDLAIFCQELQHTMGKDLGLAAPQVGELRRIIVTQDAIMINPQIAWKRGVQVDWERCLSVPKKRVKIRRAKTVRVTFQDPQGRWHAATLTGLKARVVQHEIDHLDGKLISSGSDS